MQKWIWIVVGAAAVVLAVVIALPGFSSIPPAPPRGDAGVGSSDAAAALVDAEPASATALGGSGDAGAALAEAPSLHVDFLAEAGALALPDKTPKAVRCGVILVTFAGAQGAPANARSRADAKALAEKLAGDARTDFRGAVAHGDSGSAEDIGRIPRGVLEAPLEYALFTLPAGGVSDPVEAPRGFWIAKRIE